MRGFLRYIVLRAATTSCIPKGSNCILKAWSNIFTACFSRSLMRACMPYNWLQPGCIDGYVAKTPMQPTQLNGKLQCSFPRCILIHILLLSRTMLDCSPGCTETP